MLRIDLLRHGETTLGHTLRGSTDDALTKLGWSQMQQTVEQSINQSLNYPLNWDVIFSSPLKRCRLFAQHIATQHQLPLLSAASLQEMHFGDWEATPTEEIYNQYPELLANFWQYPTQFTPPNAESMLEFQSRVLAGLAHIQTTMRENGWQHALIMTHGGVVKLLKCLALKQPLDDVLKMSAQLGQLNSFTLHPDGSIQLLEHQQ